MKVLGYCIFETIAQRRLVDGAQIDLPRAELLPQVLADARVGDLIWVKEPWALITSTRHSRQNIREVVVGPVIGRNRDLAPHVKAILNQLRQQPKPAYALARSDSRATLVIESIGAETVQVAVRLVQVDQLRRQNRRAA